MRPASSESRTSPRCSRFKSLTASMLARCAFTSIPAGLPRFRTGSPSLRNCVPEYVLGKKPLELPPLFTLSLREQRLGVGFVQMRGEHEQTRELNRTAAELLQHSRELESEAGHPDPLEGGVFSVSEVFDAKSVERRVSVFEVEPAAIDFD